MPNRVDNLSTKMASALFTIEQIELIRRLRNSGITKEQVAMAFDQMDRLDAELGKPSTSSIRPNIPHYPNICSSLQALDRIDRDQDSSPSSVHGQIPNGVSKTDAAPPFFKQGESQSYSRPHSSSNSSTDGATDGGSSTQNGDASPSANANSSVASPTSRLSSELTIIPLTSSASSVPVSYSSADGNIVQSHIYNNRSADGASNCVPIQCLVNPLDLLQDECYELDELKKKGEMTILSEIRNFVMRYNIKQTMIAEMTKMSQAYVSRFFRGDIQDMSDRTKNAFYMWYLTCKNNPWKLTQLCPNSGVKRMVSESGDLIPLKRERFTFKAAHLAVLERYYEKDPYPDSQTREQIVDECNKAVERAVRISDRPLAERERVTLPVVNNWFNNRRKEAKKQLRQQHAAAMAAVSVSMSPLGQPSLNLPPVASMPALSWHQSPTSTALGGVAGFPGSAHQPAFHPNAQLDLSSEAMDSDSSHDSNADYGNGDALPVEIEEDDDGKATSIKQEV
ncbi:homeobox-containing protein 1-like [Uloborus diversus]|uniref:homeobox-containing protein 1-like n=1 Tax=Uloborus diversus TaxID=327109 RepID=UPI00240A6F5C|nr:homeobox-containing protein 1-like [Uloborus diversus]